MSELLNSLASVKTSHPHKFSAVPRLHKCADVNSVTGERLEVEASSPSGSLNSVCSARNPYILTPLPRVRIYVAAQQVRLFEYFSQLKTKVHSDAIKHHRSKTAQEVKHIRVKKRQKQNPRGMEVVLRNVFIME